MLRCRSQGPARGLSLVTDGFSRKIVGHYVHDSLQTQDLAASSNELN